jgi:hypothetical protein
MEEDARSHMAQRLRCLAEKLESDTNPATLIHMNPSGFQITIATAEISVQTPVNCSGGLVRRQGLVCSLWTWLAQKRHLLARLERGLLF